MPDLGTHLASAWLIGRLGSLRPGIGGRDIYLLCAGTVLPDVLSRAPHLALDVLGTSYGFNLQYLTRPLHTPAALFFVTLAVSYFFEERTRARTFAALAMGALFHCLLDACQVVGPNQGYLWFYPFSSSSPQLNLFSGDRTLLAIPYLAGAALLLEGLIRLRRPRNEKPAAILLSRGDPPV